MHSQVSGGANLSNFPVLISRTDLHLATRSNGGYVQNSSGYDIIFVDSTETTKLDHEIESYTASTGAIIMWVRIPTLSAGSDTIIYMYYGNPSITSSQEHVTGVWNASYLGVYHLGNGSTLSVADSTSQAANGTNHSATATTGQIDGAANFSGSSQYVTLPSTGFPTGASPFTVELWMKPGTNAGKSVWWLGTFGGQQQVGLDYNSAFGQLNLYDGSDNVVNNILTVGTWGYVVATYDGSTLLLYVNGTQQLSLSVTLNLTYGNAYLGNDPFSDYYTGVIDEYRISSVARTRGWIATGYNSQSVPSSFYSVGGGIANPYNILYQPRSVCGRFQKQVF